MAVNPLQQAAQLAKSGQIEEARRELESLIQENPQNIPAWFWYAVTYKTIEERIQVLETCARLNPDNAEVKQRLEKLRGQQPAASTPALQTASQTPQPTANDKQAVDARTETRSSQGSRRPLAWLLWSLAAVLAVAVIALTVYMIKNTPVDPGAYRHSEPSEYYLYVPRSYQPGRSAPLFIGIHGQGGSGRDCWNLWQSYADRENFILLCPSLSDPDGGWSQGQGEQKLSAILQQVVQTYNVEPHYFLAGFSAGALFVQGVAFHYPGSVKAVSVLSSGNYIDPSSGAQGIPFQVIIGDADDPEAVETSQLFARDLQASGSTVDYWLLPGVGHQVTDKTRQLTIDFFRKINGK